MTTGLLIRGKGTTSVIIRQVLSGHESPSCYALGSAENCRFRIFCQAAETFFPVWSLTASSILWFASLTFLLLWQTSLASWVSSTYGQGWGCLLIHGETQG